jgi:hypothetical protein
MIKLTIKKFKQKTYHHMYIYISYTYDCAEYIYIYETCDITIIGYRTTSYNYDDINQKTWTRIVPGAQGPVMMGAPNGPNGPVAGPCGSCGSFGAMMWPANGQMQPVPW